MNALPFVTIPPDRAPKPLIVVLPCAGVRLSRADLARMADLPVNGRLHDIDLQVERLVSTAPALGAQLFAGTVHRYVCDVSKDPTQLDARLCPQLGKGTFPHGVIWRTTSWGASVHEGNLPVAEVEQRLQKIHTLFHERLAQLVSEMVARFGRATLLEVRTAASTGRSAESDAGKPRPDAALGSASADTLGPIHDYFTGHRFRVGRLPAPSYIAQRHGSAAVEVVELVLNRRLYLHEEVPYWAGAPALELQQLMTGLLERL